MATVALDEIRVVNFKKTLKNYNLETELNITNS